jgi:hypothetical protein
MKGRAGRIELIIVVSFLAFSRINAQISPGELSSPHSYLEGISNCTKCHVLGNKVSNDKCLSCHKEIGNKINSRKGFHSSSEVTGKECIKCHSDHHGKNFQLVRLDPTKFDHNLTGYVLSIPHSKKECKDCHNEKFIAEENIKTKKYTFLGVSPECLNCHTDYHQKSLSTACLDCHIPDSFKPASRFNHTQTKFPLKGKHLQVECSKCHKIETADGKKFQQFHMTQLSSCANCHKDPHKNQFGQNCSQCHSEESFQIIKGVKGFDHDKTSYRLEEKHQTVNCKACHKTKFTDPVKHDYCTDCHPDYHNRQFVKNGVSPDCAQCHTVKGFTLFSYTVDQHNLGVFKLQGAHMATPCFDCHKKQDRWNFKGIGLTCKECHTDIHQNFIESKYYPESNCKICHNENRWSDVRFNHSLTDFDLTGAHTKQGCRACHISTNPDGTLKQKFSGLSGNCTECHQDRHFKQFEKGGITNCTECHDTENWKASKFDHNKTAFRLDGKHINVPCAKCHKPQHTGSDYYVIYKLKEFKCESCHF